LECNQLKATNFYLIAQALLLSIVLGTGAACAGEAPTASEAELLRGIVHNLLDDNNAFVKSHKPGYFKPFADGQHPRATVVTCSDSRVQTTALDKTPDGDLFMVRDIGNQIATAEGSVEYGVHHLHTPLLIIVGHVACGAIKAAQGDYSKEPASIRRELASIKLPERDPKNSESEAWLRGVDANVNNQVAFALKKYEKEVKDGSLTVIGAVYDFRNDLHQGLGRLVITNINGSTDAHIIMAELMKFSGIGAQPDKTADDKAGKKTEH